MAAPKKNKNAQKWTEKKVRNILSKLGNAAKKPENLFIGQQLVRLKLYRDIWSYWKEKFKDNEHIMEEISLIEGMYEVNILKASMSGSVPARIAIFSLRNAHGWRNDPTREEATIVADMKVVREADELLPEATISENIKRAS